MPYNFYDMAKLSKDTIEWILLPNAKVYDKPVWGHLYGEALQDIKCSYREWLRRNY